MSRLRLSWDWLTDYRSRLRFRCGSTDFAEPSIIDICVYITLDGSFWRRGVPEKRPGLLGTDAISHSRSILCQGRQPARYRTYDRITATGSSGRKSDHPMQHR